MAWAVAPARPAAEAGRRRAWVAGPAWQLVGRGRAPAAREGRLRLRRCQGEVELEGPACLAGGLAGRAFRAVVPACRPAVVEP